MENWLRSVMIKNDSPLHGHLIRFLSTVGVDDQEGLEALVMPFKEIVPMIGDEYNAITLMKIKNALWHSTGLPHEMKREASIADILFLLKHKDYKDGHRQLPRSQTSTCEPDERQPLAYTGQAISGINQVNKIV